MKYEIMMSILFELLTKKCVNAKYLANKYQVSVRSIYRYVDALTLADVPIYTIRGGNGGFSIIDTYKLPSTFMTIEEFNQVVDALEAVNNNISSKPLSSAILKLKASKKNENNDFELKSGNLIIDASPWGDTIGYKSKLAVIQNSIENQFKLEIEYHDRNGEVSNRIIEPHYVLFKQGLWYIYAYCNLRKEFRFFKTGRIANAKILNEKFERKDLTKEEIPLDFKTDNPDSIQVVFEIGKTILSDVEEWLGIENVKKIEDKYIAEVMLPLDNGLVSKIISYGKDLKVISPKSLKEKIMISCSEILNNY
jgi:predicted DNA-binding transcriptional regulator YafY